MAKEIQVYGCDDAGKLVHAGPRFFLEGVSLADQCRSFELAWRRWRDRHLSDWKPRLPIRGWKQTRKDSAPIDDRKNATVYVLVDNESGARLGEFGVA